ncbi:hypothetical protein DEDE109153_18060 [Deinococcus deserti]|nr:hypothetical protein [Deinococcus deserti]
MTNDSKTETNLRDMAENTVKAEFATLAQVRQVLGLSGHQVASAVRSGKLKAKRVEFIVRPEDVAEFHDSYIEVTEGGIVRVRTTPKPGSNQ